MSASKERTFLKTKFSLGKRNGIYNNAKSQTELTFLNGVAKLVNNRTPQSINSLRLSIRAYII